jgi:hypothetical protein
MKTLKNIGELFWLFLLFAIFLANVLFPVILAVLVGNYWLILLYVVWWMPGLVIHYVCSKLIDLI